MLHMVVSSSVNGHYRHEANEGGQHLPKFEHLSSQWCSSIRPYQQYQSMTPYQHLYMSKPCDYYLSWSYIQQSLTSKAADLAPAGRYFHETHKT